MKTRTGYSDREWAKAVSQDWKLPDKRVILKERIATTTTVRLMTKVTFFDAGLIPREFEHNRLGDVTMAWT